MMPTVSNSKNPSGIANVVSPVSLPARGRRRAGPAAGGERGVTAHLVVRVEPPLGLQGGQHELVAAEERDELLAVAPHVDPALPGLVLVAEDQLRLAGGQVDCQPGDLPRV